MKKSVLLLISDRECQFTSVEYQQFLAAHQVTCTMSTVGSCADNAAVERFFSVLKRERVNRRQYQTRAEAMITSSAGTIPGGGGDSISSNRGGQLLTQLSVGTE